MTRPIVDTTWKGVPHFRIRADVTDSPAWRVLSYPAKALYVDLRAKLRSNNNGNVNATLEEMRHRGWKSSATLSTALYQLIALGFIVKTRGGGVERGSRVCSLYAFTDLEVNAFPKAAIERRKATFEYRQYPTLTEAKQALRAGIEALRAEAVARKRGTAEKRAEKTRAPRKNDASDSEQVKPSDASDSEQVGNSVVHFPNKTEGTRNRPKAAPVLSLRDSGPLDTRPRPLLQKMNTLLN